MRKQRMCKQGILPVLLKLALACLFTCALSACLEDSTPKVATPTPAPFLVTSVDLAVTPTAIAAGTFCGASAVFTYTATFYIPPKTAGGKIEFVYIVNGHMSTAISVPVGPGQIVASYTFTDSGPLDTNHTYPGSVKVLVTSPNVLDSPEVKPSGACTQAVPFQVTSIDMAVDPTSIDGIACGTNLTVTYTATFHIAPNSPGGTILFIYTVNNGRATTNGSLTVGPGQTLATYTFSWSGALPPEHTYPSFGGVITTSPNAVQSPQVEPDGLCS